ncbi:MAG: Haloacid dehalogenase domain protein hydrolase [Myxococcales bacterium]|nr:Haloacid dehalogenase domain protein hydrolase [Myxococcales bacterium]
MDPRPTTIPELLASHDGVLLDAYGVLVDAVGALPGAKELIGELNRKEVPYAVVTNDASRTPATYVGRFASFGLEIPASRIVTSGSLLPGYFRERGLAGARTVVLGTPDSYAYVTEGGGIPIALAPGMQIDAVAICDDAGTPFLEGIELTLSAIVRAIEAGRRPALVLPNPDLVYPKGGGELGFTAGAMALLIEAALARRFPTANLVFDRLGKPSRHLLLEGKRRLGRDRVVMIGDQLETDIAAALAAGIECALLAGVSRWDGRSTIVPTYLLSSLAP